MPDRSAIEAATPKCPQGPDWDSVLPKYRAKERCGRLLSFEDDYWRCPVHGNVTTPESLVHRQGAKA